MSVNSKLVAKSIESVLLAIELYNKPLITYRTDAVLVLLINSWESALKALILKKKWAKINVNKRKEFLECVECVKSNLGNNYPDDWYASVVFLYEERCKIIHYNKDMVLIDYMLIQANIILFKQLVEKQLSKSITKKVNWMVLPLGFEVPYTEFDFLNKTSSLAKSTKQISEYYKKITELHNSQLEKGSGGILLSINVTMQNVNKVNKADLVVGIKKDSNVNFSYENTIKLSNTGKETKIKEVTEALSVFNLHYKDILMQVKKTPGHSQAKLTEFMKKIGKIDENLSFNWAKFGEIFPMKLSNKYTFSEEILKKYKEYLEKQK